MVKFTRETKAINSKVLFNKIHNYVLDGLTDDDIKWNSEIHRNAFVEVTEEMLFDLEDSDKLDQSKVICDLRNNSTKDMMHGVFIIEIHYKQTNCINTTKIKYKLYDSKSDFYANPK